MPGAERSGRGVGGQEYFFLFDYLRIVLAVGVYVAHADHDGHLPFHFGNACVQVFFALSGFLIGGILLASTPADLPRFYFNRCTRIWLPYGLAILLLFVGTALRQSLHDPKIWEFFFYKATFVYNLFGTQQLDTFHDRMPLSGTGNHFWSICIEEQFYLVAPFLILFARRWLLPALLGLLLLNVFKPHLFASIAFGVLLALSRRQFGDWYLSTRGRVACVITLVVTTAIFSWRADTYMIFVAPAAASVVALVAIPGASRPLGVTLGGMSYPFYLNHWLGLFVRNPLRRILHCGWFEAGVVGLALALAYSFVHYRLIDRAVHERRGSWYTRDRGYMACATAILLIVVGVAGGMALK